MMFKCKRTGEIMTPRQVRRSRANFVLDDGRKVAMVFPKDPAKWDKKFMAQAAITRVKEVAP